MKKWLVYFVNSAGHREGTEKILARNREEAIRDYKLLFNVHDDCRAIPIYSREVISNFRG